MYRVTLPPCVLQVFRLPQLMLDAPEVSRVLAKARSKLLELYGDLEKVCVWGGGSHHGVSQLEHGVGWGWVGFRCRGASAAGPGFFLQAGSATAGPGSYAAVAAAPDTCVCCFPLCVCACAFTCALIGGSIFPTHARKEIPKQLW